MKTKRFRIENLRNEEWFQFYTEFKNVAEEYTAETLEIEDLFTRFLTLYANADEALEVIRKSLSTRQIAEADRERDAIFRGFSDAVKSAGNHFQGNKRLAAEHLRIIFNQYGNVTRKPYDEETASIYNFLQDMKANEEHVTELGLSDWVKELEMQNKAFESYMKNRYDETASRTTLRMKEIRLDTDRCYRNILDRIDALIIVKGETTFAPFVRDMAVRADRFEKMLAQRKGRANKDDNPVIITD